MRYFPIETHTTKLSFEGARTIMSDTTFADVDAALTHAQQFPLSNALDQQAEMMRRAFVKTQPEITTFEQVAALPAYSSDVYVEAFVLHSNAEYAIINWMNGLGRVLPKAFALRKQAIQEAGIQTVEYWEHVLEGECTTHIATRQIAGFTPALKTYLAWYIEQ